MSKVRFRYSKTGRAGYISHLDLMATMQRAFLRAGVKLKYSEGFNPHPYISAALPLPVGCESICELIDVGIIDGSLPDIKSIKMPEGIIISEVYTPDRKAADITWIEIICHLHYDRETDEGIADKLYSALTKEVNIISKRTKRGFKELDIAPYIKNVELLYDTNDKNVQLKAKIFAQNPTINISDIENAIGDSLKPDFFELKRIDIYDANMVIFN